MALTRRRLFVSAGAGVLGISVVTTIGACSSPADSPDPPDGPPAGGASGGPSSGGPSGGPSSGGPGEVVAGGWRRVNLSFVSAYLLIRGNEAAIVDLGTPGSGAAIEAGLKAGGVGWDAVRHVIITHMHSDHAGSAGEVAPKITNGSLYSGAADAGAIRTPTAVKPVNDGDEIFGLRIIGTPGHTAGHVAVFDPSVGVLVAGDALTTTQGLAAPDARNTSNMTEALASIRKLATLDVRVILPGHGPPLTTGAAEALAKLAAS
jgi:glyoxylase-like metal-dependent hydrolase (beta-lactamase superfamily II)